MLNLFLCSFFRTSVFDSILGVLLILVVQSGNDHLDLMKNLKYLSWSANILVRGMGDMVLLR